MKRPEQTLQIQVAKYLRYALRKPTMWTAFPAGGGGKKRGAFLKAMGLRAGWPDILVVHPTTCSAGVKHPIVVGLELKAKKGSLSQNQRDVRDEFDHAGCPFLVCKSVDDVERLLRTFGVPLKGTVLGGRS